MIIADGTPSRLGQPRRGSGEGVPTSLRVAEQVAFHEQWLASLGLGKP